jgi:hypothetical protein
MTRNAPICPVCNSLVPYKDVHFGFSFPCNACKNYLYVSSVYSCVHAAVALCLAMLIAAGVGIRGEGFIFACLILWFPMIVLDVNFFVRSFPPKLRLHHFKDSPLSLGG